MQLYDSRFVENGLAMKPATLRHYADRLQAAPHGRSGKARMWSFRDIVLVLIAQRLVDRRGFITPVAIELAKAMEPELERLVASPEAGAWMLARPDPKRLGGYIYMITRSSKEALDNVDPNDPPLIINVRNYVKEASDLGFTAVTMESQGDA